jgi:hypothetical protein
MNQCPSNLEYGVLQMKHLILIVLTQFILVDLSSAGNSKEFFYKGLPQSTINQLASFLNIKQGSSLVFTGKTGKSEVCKVELEFDSISAELRFRGYIGNTFKTFLEFSNVSFTQKAKEYVFVNSNGSIYEDRISSSFKLEMIESNNNLYFQTYKSVFVSFTKDRSFSFMIGSRYASMMSGGNPMESFFDCNNYQN